MATAIELDPDIAAGWGPGARFFSGSDGKHFVVQADLGDYSELRDRIKRRPTLVFYVDANAVAEDFVVDFRYDPGTPHEEAVAASGYELVAE